MLGDSLSAAYGLQPEQGWVALLEDQLSANYSDIEVVNGSISGDTSAGGLRRLPGLLEEHDPELVIIELGANDGLRGFSIKALEANLRSLVEQSQGSGADVILVPMLVPPNYGKRYADQFAAVYPKLAQEMDITLAPFLLNDVAGKPELIQDDGLHPVAEAQPIILNNLLAVITSHVEQLAASPTSNDSFLD